MTAPAAGIMTMTRSPFIIGRQEWLALPELGLPAIKAKIDTGARTSALHAFRIEPFGPISQPKVRFGVHPIPGRLDVEIFTSAPIVDRREVMSSNGEKEMRYFIRTPVRLGDREWDIEIGLTNRESMTYRMLLGRQAIRDDIMVDAGMSFRQQRLSYKLYRSGRDAIVSRRPLRIALVAREAAGAFNGRLESAAARRGHSLEILDVARLALSFERDAATVVLDGAQLAHYDAVIPRIGLREGAGGAAVIRQFEATGCMALNPGDALDRVHNKLAAAQVLVRQQVPQVLRPALGGGADAAGEDDLRVLVVGGKAVAIIANRDGTFRAQRLVRHRAERRVAEHAAEALALGLATINVAERDGEAVVSGISANPVLGRFARLSKLDLAETVVEALEARVQVRPRVMRSA